MKRIGALLPLGSNDCSLHHGARRRSSRFPLNAEITVLEPHEAQGITLNASAGGIRVVLDQKLELGTHCLLLVRFTEERFSEEEARVVWLREMKDGWVVGLEFLNIKWEIPDLDISRAA